MKVVDRDPEGGVTILDPVGLARIIANSKRGFASGVLTPSHLVVSTIPLTTHHECAGSAGMDVDDIDWDDPDPGVGDIRLQLGPDTVEAEFWYHDEEVYHRGVCPLTEERLAEVSAWISAHPAILRAYAGSPPKVWITLLHDGIRMWHHHTGAIHETPDTPPLPGAGPSP